MLATDDLHTNVHFYEQKDITQQGIFDEWSMPFETDCLVGELDMMKHLCQLMPHLNLYSSSFEASVIPALGQV